VTVPTKLLTYRILTSTACLRVVQFLTCNTILKENPTEGRVTTFLSGPKYLKTSITMCRTRWPIRGITILNAFDFVIAYNPSIGIFANTSRGAEVEINPRLTSLAAIRDAIIELDRWWSLCASDRILRACCCVLETTSTIIISEVLP